MKIKSDERSRLALCEYPCLCFIIPVIWGGSFIKTRKRELRISCPDEGVRRDDGDTTLQRNWKYGKQKMQKMRTN